jgi:hypothetical protein
MEKMQIVREAAEGVPTTDLATRFGVTARAVRYVLKADAERQTDSAIPVSAVSVKVTTAELAALDAVSIGIQSGPLIGVQKGPLWRGGSWPEAA